MSIQHYLKMIDNASVAQRCHAAAALAHIYLQTDLEFDERCSTEAVLTLLLDDPSPKVRLALAEAFSTSAHAPVHIVASLARDQIEVATYILGRSTLLSDTDLIDCVAGGGCEAQRIIAARPKVSFAVSAAIIEIGETVAVLELLSNTQAQIADISFRRLIERLGHIGEIRSLLVEDERLPADCRHTLAIRIAEALCQMDMVMALMGERRAKRIAQEACIRASISLVAATPSEEYPALIEHLQLRGDLTTAFVIRIVAAGKIDFFGAILVALSGHNLARVRSLLIDGRATALNALFGAAGLPDSTYRPLGVALQAWRGVASGKLAIGSQEVILRMIEQIAPDNRATGTVPPAANDDMLSLLKRLYLDAIRENAREHALAIAAA
ncbi:hypothetical protein CU102_13225 [Phyllobacterium brassicacearum]|uniref:DUF2336 domain-containing protein n=1 Tax=Phyllobacterium brassicacearum TaxID=314235 RepID=A0A2P7BQF4_9HYPH|nr:DUF2336 domain-containing protein [Phyllobacterium brassicacearum]PSH68703.1 hypothetical protein CU102_13225 [Phyllobacterium brassicacearum]TDQ24263.1 uncharacterized protein (DUF2336 family) [Phyllobacterium brassicacearum]